MQAIYNCQTITLYTQGNCYLLIYELYHKLSDRIRTIAELCDAKDPVIRVLGSKKITRSIILISVGAIDLTKRL